MINKESWVVPSQYTYKDMTKPEKREWMSKCDVASLGTQSGGYGVFTEQFRVVTKSGAKKIRSEIDGAFVGMDSDSLLKHCPTLRELLK